MSLKEIYSQNLAQKNNFPVISFEIFPPKNDEDGVKLEKLISHLKILKRYNPAFISLTYGAGGTTRNNSLDIIKRIKSELDIKVMPHFTCVCTSKSQVACYLQDISSLGIKNILALRGDIPDGVEAKDFDFHFANELVEYIKCETNLSIGVAGYPEGHIDAPTLEFDIENLKRKVDAGADAIYTQMFFDNAKFFSFVETCQKSGITIPIIPGILPIRSYTQLEKMLTMAKVTLPESLMQQLEKYKDSPDAVKQIGIDFASSQCRQLVDYGVSGLHFFTLNTSSSIAPILDNLGVQLVSQD